MATQTPEPKTSESTHRTLDSAPSMSGTSRKPPASTPHYQALANGSSRVSQLQRYQQVSNPIGVNPLQSGASVPLVSPIGTSSVPIQRKPNQTGLSDNLKSGIESLSGTDISDVKVHYNSPKPAQLNAHAYAQGTDIHVASGQEKHVPHEAWHVVQQKQGRVQPTTSVNGAQVNDNPALEKEADVMGSKALQAKAISPFGLRKTPNTSGPIQTKSKVFQLGRTKFTTRKSRPYPKHLNRKFYPTPKEMMRMEVKRAFWRKRYLETDIPSDPQLKLIVDALHNGHNPRMARFKSILVSRKSRSKIKGPTGMEVDVPELAIIDQEFPGVGRLGREAPKNRYFPGKTNQVSDGAIPSSGDARRSVIITQSAFNALKANTHRFTTHVRGPYNLHAGNMPTGDRPANDLNKVVDSEHGHDRSAHASGITHAENLHMRAWSLGGSDTAGNLFAGSHNLNSAMITAEAMAKELGLQSSSSNPTTYKVTALTEKKNNTSGKPMDWVYAVAIEVNGAGKNGTFYMQQQLDGDDPSYIKKEYWDEVEGKKNQFLA